MSCTISIAAPQDRFWKSARTRGTRLPKGLPTRAKSPQRRLAIDLHRRAATRRRRAAAQAAGPNTMGSLAQAHLRRPQRNRTTCGATPRHRCADRDPASLVKATYCCSPPAAIASRGARQAEPASTDGSRDSPRRCASEPPRARTGHPILATCEARDRAPRVPIGQASVSRRIRRGRLRAVLDSLARGESLG